MNQYKTLIIYSISNDQLKKLFENELEKYGLERVGEQGIFALPLEEYRTKVQALKSSTCNSSGIQTVTDCLKVRHTADSLPVPLSVCRVTSC